MALPSTPDEPAYRLWIRRFKRYRTPVLAVLATGMLVASAIGSFDIPWQEVAGYLLICVLGVASIAGAAALMVFLIKSLSGR
jgi:hypothetical protein